jgi:DNA polymerase-1
VRKLYRARPGKVFASCDLSQIELRVGAGLSQDSQMIQAFVDGADPHARTASMMFGVPEEEVDPLRHRLPCKNLNFAMWYGATARKVREMAGEQGVIWSLQEAEDFRQRWLGIYPEAGKYLDRLMADARRLGYVESWLSRRIYVQAVRLQGDRWPFSYLREKGERQGKNGVIQTTAQEIEKLGMVRLWEAMREWEDTFYWRPLLQIHDDVLSEVDESMEEVARQLTLDAMTSLSPWKSVPITATWKSGDNWGDLS